MPATCHLPDLQIRQKFLPQRHLLSSSKLMIVQSLSHCVCRDAVEANRAFNTTKSLCIKYHIWDHLWVQSPIAACPDPPASFTGNSLEEWVLQYWIKGWMDNPTVCLHLPHSLRKNQSSRGSHIDIACKSVRDRDQNGIKRSMFILGADQGFKTNSEWLISTDQHTFSDT